MKKNIIYILLFFYIDSFAQHKVQILPAESGNVDVVQTVNNHADNIDTLWNKVDSSTFDYHNCYPSLSTDNLKGCSPLFIGTTSLNSIYIYTNDTTRFTVDSLGAINGCGIHEYPLNSTGAFNGSIQIPDSGFITDFSHALTPNSVYIMGKMENNFLSPTGDFIGIVRGSSLTNYPSLQIITSGITHINSGDSLNIICETSASITSLNDIFINSINSSNVGTKTTIDRTNGLDILSDLGHINMQGSIYTSFTTGGTGVIQTHSDSSILITGGINTSTLPSSIKIKSDSISIICDSFIINSQLKYNPLDNSDSINGGVITNLGKGLSTWSKPIYVLQNVVLDSVVTLIGGTTNLTNNAVNIITAATTITSQTINFPTGVNKDEITIILSKDITTLTINGSGTSTILYTPSVGMSRTFKNFNGRWY